MRLYKCFIDKFRKTKYINMYRWLRRTIKNAWYKTLSDEDFLKMYYKNIFGIDLDIKNPKTYNEKLQWLKLYCRDPKASMCSDKYEVRSYLEQKGLGHLLNHLMAVYDNVDDIVFDDLPEKFVLKCTHGSGCNIICNDKSALNWSEAKKKLRKWMKTNYYWFGREWVYKDLKPRIICERFLEDKENNELLDYKFFCFDGRPEMIFFCSDRADHVKSDFYDLDWQPLPFRWEYEPSGKVFKRPSALNEMIEYSKILSKGFPHVRVDFYLAGGKVYFGELTFFHGGGFGRFFPDKIDSELGDKIQLPQKIL